MIRFKKTMTNTFPRWLCNSYLCVVNESSVTSYLHFDIFTFKFYYTVWAIVDLSFIWWLVVLNISFFFLSVRLFIYEIYTQFGGPSWWLRWLKKSSYNAGHSGSIPGLENLLEKGTGTHSSILAQRIPWTEECGGL